MFREEEVMYHVKSRQEQKIELIRFICEQIGSIEGVDVKVSTNGCLLYTSPSPRDISGSRMPSSA